MLIPPYDDEDTFGNEVSIKKKPMGAFPPLLPGVSSTFQSPPLTSLQGTKCVSDMQKSGVRAAHLILASPPEGQLVWLLDPSGSLRH